MDFFCSCVKLLFVRLQVSLPSERSFAQFAVKCRYILTYSDLMNRQRMFSQRIVKPKGFRTVATFFSSCFGLGMTLILVVGQYVIGNKCPITIITRKTSVFCDDFFMNSVQIRLVCKFNVGYKICKSLRLSVTKLAIVFFRAFVIDSSSCFLLCNLSIFSVTNLLSHPVHI